MTNPPTHCRVACIQCNSQNNRQENIATILPMIAQAAKDGAECITLPENVAMMSASSAELMEKACTEAEHPALAPLRDAASQHNIWLLIGSLAVKDRPESTHLRNRSFLINPSGEITARYDKIHLYRVQLPDGDYYDESRNYESGTLPVTAETPWGTLGMTICYDLRFPQLFRRLAQSGAGIITVPSAFVRLTGKAHWHSLLRARAIENGCFIIAPAQCGDHPANRKTYGHSLIINPWGEIIAEAGESPQILHATLGLSDITTARNAIPSLKHDVPFS